MTLTIHHRSQNIKPGSHIYRGTDKSGTVVAQWLRCYATNRKVAGSIPGGVTGLFIDIKSYPRVESATNRNEYKEHFLGVKEAGA